MRIIHILCLLCLQTAVSGQIVADFENYKLQPGQYINNAFPEGSFSSGSVILPNDYNDEFGIWSGFAISADTNTRTPGFFNQYSSIVGKGVNGSTAYAVGYVFDPVVINLKEKALGKPMVGMYVTNTTYTYLSMLDGDAFAKKFGGETGSDPDFFMLTIKKYAGGVISDDSINVYLADYRSPDPHKDYILSTWKYVDLNALGEIDSLVLLLRSSDVGIFGMNTPAYVAIDDITTDDLLAAYALDKNAQAFQFGPNPAKDYLYLDVPNTSTCTLMTMDGTVVWSGVLAPGRHDVKLSSLSAGIYLISRDGKIAGRVCIE